MFLSLILTALLGQCANGQCDLAPSANFYYPAISQLPAIQAPRVYELKRFDVTYDGLDVTIEGWQKVPGGEINWRLSDPYNVTALRKARQAATAKPVARITPIPKTRGAVAADPFPGGVDPAKTSAGPSYHAGSVAARRFVAELVRPSADAGDEKLHVTVIGTVDDAAQVLNDIKTDPAFEEIRDKLLVQEYRDGEWPVDPSLGFKSGRPSIVIQADKGDGDPKGGRVLYRAADYSMGPKGLAEAIRKADPNYRPDDDPGPANPGKPSKPDKDAPVPKPLCPLGFNRSHKAMVFAVAAVCVFLYILPRKETVKS